MTTTKRRTEKAKEKKTRTTTTSSNDTGNQTSQLLETTQDSIQPPDSTSDSNARTSTRQNTTTSQASTSSVHTHGTPNKQIHQRSATPSRIYTKITTPHHSQSPRQCTIQSHEPQPTKLLYLLDTSNPTRKGGSGHCAPTSRHLEHLQNNQKRDRLLGATKPLSIEANQDSKLQQTITDNYHFDKLRPTHQDTSTINPRRAISRPGETLHLATARGKNNHAASRHHYH